MIERTGPGGGAIGLREALYAGRVFCLSPAAASIALADDVRARLVRVPGSEDPRGRAAELDNDTVFACVGAIRRELFASAEVHAIVREILAAQGFDPDEVAIDPPRLRAILPGGARVEAARAVYYAHRDTWYGHPPSLITWWVPLDDLDDDETFVFYPDEFTRPVDNDSEGFDYAAWTRQGLELRIGWQDPEAGVRERYPSGPGALQAPSVGFSCRRGENLLFSGAHLHRTLPIEGQRARFSVDFRVVHLGDHAAGRGAPNVDGRATGSALADYLHPVRR